MTALPTADSPQSRRRRWIYRLSFALMLLAALYLARGPLLRGMACLLIFEDSASSVDCVVPIDGDRVWERAAELYHTGAAKGLLVFRDPPSRLERLGVLPELTGEIDRERKKHDLPESALEVLKLAKPGDWNRARGLHDWLNEHSQARVLLLCDRFSSRRLHAIFVHELGPQAERVHWQALPDRRYDETNWQHDKAGQLQVFDAYLGWGHVWLYGETLGEREEWEPDTYQNSLR